MIMQSDLDMPLPFKQVKHELDSLVRYFGEDCLVKYQNIVSQLGVTKDKEVLIPPQLLVSLGVNVVGVIRDMLQKGYCPEMFERDMGVVKALANHIDDVSSVYMVGSCNWMRSSEVVYADILRFWWSESGENMILQSKDRAGKKGGISSNNCGSVGVLFEEQELLQCDIKQPYYIEQYNKRLGVVVGVYMSAFNCCYGEGGHLSCSFVSSKFPENRLPYYMSVRYYKDDTITDLLRRIGETCISKQCAHHGVALLDVLYQAFKSRFAVYEGHIKQKTSYSDQTPDLKKGCIVY